MKIPTLSGKVPQQRTVINKSAGDEMDNQAFAFNRAIHAKQLSSQLVSCWFPIDQKSSVPLILGSVRERAK